ncbi:membrane protein [Candidatus Acidianus copahuensis]|uniref:Membrane protein n=1 Tax=Candidatus Acidianus copahuensis TaxID=1160895 RepID=A0A031LPV7_9CREN|nr:membrane protein [Candidatus Acidianus copahuensis]EZQ07041.1 membrane protein [Candidatus Acidianus copahuensis]
MLDIAVFLAALAISLLELSEASAVAVIFTGITKNLKPYLYAIAGILLVLMPVFIFGRLITLLPINYVLIAASFILAYFGYRMIRSARRSFKKLKWKRKDEKEEGIITVFVVGATEAFEAGLVIIALIPQSFSSALLGTITGAVAVIGLTAALKSRIMRIRVPQLKFVLSALLFALASTFLGEALIGIDEIYLVGFFLGFLGLNYAIVKL